MLYLSTCFVASFLDRGTIAAGDEFKSFAKINCININSNLCQAVYDDIKPVSSRKSEMFQRLRQVFIKFRIFI